MTENSKPEIGHVVSLWGSDVYMSVEGHDGDNVCCVWFNVSRRLERDVFRPEILRNRTLEWAEERKQREALWREKFGEAGAKMAKREELERKAEAVKREEGPNSIVNRWAVWGR